MTHSQQAVACNWKEKAVCNWKEVTCSWKEVTCSWKELDLEMTSMEWATAAQKDWAHGFWIQPGDVLVCDWYVHLLRKCRRQYRPTVDDGEAVGPRSMSIMSLKILIRCH